VGTHRREIESRAFDQWQKEIQAKLAETTDGIYCEQAEILAQYAVGVVKAYRLAARQKRLKWLIAEARRHFFWLELYYKAHCRRLPMVAVAAPLGQA